MLIFNDDTVFYFINDGVEPYNIYGELPPHCIDEETLSDLSEVYGFDLLPYMHVAELDELRLYGIYDDSSMEIIFPFGQIVFDE